MHLRNQTNATTCTTSEEISWELSTQRADVVVDASPLAVAAKGCIDISSEHTFVYFTAIYVHSVFFPMLPFCFFVISR